MLLTVLISLLVLANAQVSLPGFNVDLSSWTVSGFSSGAMMATQLHVAYSDSFAGVGMIAGSLYYCAEGIGPQSLRCLDTPSGIDVSVMVTAAQDFASDGYNDATAGIVGDQMFIYHGSLDTTVYPGNGVKIQTFYNAYNTNTTTEYNIASEHGFPTDFYGGPCTAQNPPEFINNCGYNGAYETLNHLYSGSLQRPDTGTPTPGEFYQFDQAEFFTSSTPGSWSMDNVGYVYVPSACVSGITECRLHMSLHGCEQGREYLGTTYCTQTGYLEVAELNNIIIIFPQAIFTPVSNIYGCWDWWGYNTYFPQYLYACRESGQSLSMYRMMLQASSQPWQ